MTQLDAGAIPVVEDGRILGIITDRDIVLRVVGEQHAAFDTRVDEVMTTEVQTCREDASIADVIFQMTDKQVRRILIVDGADGLTGIFAGRRRPGGVGPQGRRGAGRHFRGPGQQLIPKT